MRINCAARPVVWNGWVGKVFGECERDDAGALGVGGGRRLQQFVFAFRARGGYKRSPPARHATGDTTF